MWRAEMKRILVESCKKKLKNFHSIKKISREMTSEFVRSSKAPLREDSSRRAITTHCTLLLSFLILSLVSTHSFFESISFLSICLLFLPFFLQRSRIGRPPFALHRWMNDEPASLRSLAHTLNVNLSVLLLILSF